MNFKEAVKGFGSFGYLRMFSWLNGKLLWFQECFRGSSKSLVRVDFFFVCGF